ncbi:MAG: hypothetical protein PHT84_02915 [Candidatus Pacebacteria bacterium]|nr:hypothetical protein [Candidatus Paceibacterota bacterium]
MNKKLSIPILLISVFSLVACENEKVISTNEAKTILNGIYDAQKTVDNNTLVFSYDYDSYQSVTSNGDEMTESISTFISYPDYYFYFKNVVKLNDQLVADNMAYTFLREGTFYIATQEYHDGVYIRGYTAYDNFDDSDSFIYSLYVSFYITAYKGTDYKYDLLNDQYGLLSDSFNLNYDYVNIKTTSSSNDSLRIKYRTISSSKVVKVGQYYWKDNFLKEIKTEYSDDLEYDKTTAKFDDDIKYLYPNLSNYTLASKN